MLGHQLKVFKHRTNLDIRRHLSKKNRQYWNDLPWEAVEATSVNCLKSHVDKYLEKFRGCL